MVLWQLFLNTEQAYYFVSLDKENLYFFICILNSFDLVLYQRPILRNHHLVFAVRLLGLPLTQFANSLQFSLLLAQRLAVGTPSVLTQLTPPVPQPSE